MGEQNDDEAESTIEVGGRPIAGVVGDDIDPEEGGILGSATVSTIGEDFRVPRQWLQRRMEELGISEFCPGEVSPKRAYNRMRTYLITHENDEKEIGGRMVEFEVEKVNSEVFHLEAKSYFTAQDLGDGAEEGEFRRETLGIIKWVDEHDSVATIPRVPREEDGKPHPFRASWEKFAQRAVDLHDEMMTHHIGRDIQRYVLYRFTHSYSSSIKLRDGGAVYFVPAHQDDKIRAIRTLVSEIDDKFKSSGRACEMQVIPVVDNDDQREMVSERAGVSAREQVSTVLDDAFERMEEDEEAVVDEIVDSMADDLDAIDDFVAEYNALLDVEMSVRSILDSWVSELKGEREELVEQAADVAEDEGAIS